MTKPSSKLPKHPSAREYQAVPANLSSAAIPRGLVRCEVCHEYRGAVRNDDLPTASQREEAVVAVLCICDGIPCRKCGKDRIHRPISNYWDEARGASYLLSVVQRQAPCKRCRAEQTAAHCLTRGNCQEPLDNQPNTTKRRLTVTIRNGLSLQNPFLEGHPDKLADSILDRILDAFLERDPQCSRRVRNHAC